MNKKIIAISGGFDPVHIGHVKMIEEASKQGGVLVILNSDEWLMRKKVMYLCLGKSEPILWATSKVYPWSPMLMTQMKPCVMH